MSNIPAEILQAELHRRAKKNQRKLNKLLKARAKIDEAIAELEAVTGKSVKAPKRSAKPKVRRKKRGKFKETATKFLLGLLSKGVKTRREVIGAWRKGKRGGLPDNALAKLLKAKTIKREKVEDTKNSAYKLA
jgi:hypothetical protein